MANLITEGNWNTIKGKFKQTYAQLTDDDLLYNEGQEDELFGRLQKKLGQTREGIETFIKKVTTPSH